MHRSTARHLRAPPHKNHRQPAHCAHRSPIDRMVRPPNRGRMALRGHNSPAGRRGRRPRASPNARNPARSNAIPADSPTGCRRPTPARAVRRAVGAIACPPRSRCSRARSPNPIGKLRRSTALCNSPDRTHPRARSDRPATPRRRSARRRAANSQVHRHRPSRGATPRHRCGRMKPPLGQRLRPADKHRAANSQARRRRASRGATKRRRTKPPLAHHPSRVVKHRAASSPKLRIGHPAVSPGRRSAGRRRAAFRRHRPRTRGNGAGRRSRPVASTSRACSTSRVRRRRWTTCRCGEPRSRRAAVGARPCITCPAARSIPDCPRRSCDYRNWSRGSGNPCAATTGSRRCR